MKERRKWHLARVSPDITTSTASCAAPSDVPSGEYVWRLGKALPPVVRARTDLQDQLDQCFTRLRGTEECSGKPNETKLGLRQGVCRARGLDGETCPSSHLAPLQAHMAAEHCISPACKQLYAVLVQRQSAPLGCMPDSISRSASTSERQPSARQTDERGRVAASHSPALEASASRLALDCSAGQAPCVHTCL